MNNKKQPFRNGDLSFHPIAKPENLKAVPFTGEYILALGESTGHSHRLTAVKDAVRMYRDDAGALVLEVLGKTIITHEEHKTIELVPGWYRMANEREFDYFGNSIIRVQD